MERVDVIVFAAHPDDAELAMGGTIARLSKEGKKIMIADLTEGEMGTRGSVELRREEAAAASKILSVNIRENLKIPDGNILLSDDNLRKVVGLIRKYRPSIIFAPYKNDRHTDHIDTFHLIKKANFFAGVGKYSVIIDGQHSEFYRASKIFYYMQTYEFDPTFITDISAHFQEKIAAIKAYGSQFYSPGQTGPETMISSKGFFDYIEARAKVYGFRIKKDYGEPFFCEEDIELDLSNYLKGF